MTEAKFILSKQKIIEQYIKLKEIGLKVSYSYKTNHEVGKVLQDLQETKDCEFSIHAFEEIQDIKDKSKICFFTQAESEEELRKLLQVGIRNFVVDNEVDFRRLLRVIEEEKVKINLNLRMKFQEHRVGTGKYFVYGMPSIKVNALIQEIKNNLFVDKIGVHIHRKSQNTSEWNIKQELEDSISDETLKRIKVINFGGGLPIEYRSYIGQANNYIFEKLEEAVEWLKKKGIEVYIEPGRFIAGPAIKLETEIIQIYDNKVIVNTTIYNCALDTILTGTKMLIEGELLEGEDGEDYLIKGNSPTRDDIFRYKVKLHKDIKVGDKIVFLNAGAYNYTTDFFGYKKLKTEIKD